MNVYTEARITNLKADVRNYELALQIATKLEDKLSPECTFSPSVFLWITPSNREDLAALMTIAPIWAKDYETSLIEYTAFVEGVKVTLRVSGDALPLTCKLVEEEVAVNAVPEQVIPAKPAGMEKRLVLKCFEPSQP